MNRTSYDFLDVLKGTIDDKVSTLDQTIYCKVVGVNEDYTLDVTIVPDEHTRVRNVVNASKYEFKMGDYGILYKIGNNLANAFIIAKLGPSYADNQPLSKQVADENVGNNNSGKIDNTDAVKSVNGQTGAVNITRVDEAGTADKLKTARTIALSGDATGSTTFDGSANKEISVTLSNTGVTAGTYNTVTVDAKGRVTAASSKNYSTKVVQTITGDGSKTSFDVAHTLGADVSVQVYLKNQTVGADTVDELVMVDTYTLNNKVKLLFATAPTTTQTFKVVIIG